MASKVKTSKTENMYFKQIGTNSTLSGKPLKVVDQFTYLGSNISSIESDVNIRFVKVRNAIDRLSIIWKSNLSDEIKRDFLHAVAVSILLYGCTIWTLTKRIEKKLNGKYTRMLCALLNKF